MPPQAGEGEDEEGGTTRESMQRTREKLRQSLREGKLDERPVEIDVRERNSPIEVITNQGIEEMDINLRDMLPGLFGGKSRR